MRFNPHQRSLLILLTGAAMIYFMVFRAVPAPANKDMSELIMEGRIDEAEIFLEESHGLNEHTVKYYRGLLDEDSEQSARMLKESLAGGAHFPERELAVIRLSQYYFARDFFITCINYLESFENKYPDSRLRDEAGWLLGMAYLNSGKYERAAATFRRVIENELETDYDSWAFMGLGFCYYETGSYDKAIGSFNRLAGQHSDPARPQAMAMLSHTYSLIGERKRAEGYRDDYESSYPQAFFGESFSLVEPVSVDIPIVPDVDPEAEHLVGAKYYIQIGAFSSRANASRMQNKLKKRYRAVIDRQVVNNQRYYKVLVGPYSTRAKAQLAKEKLEREEKDSYLIILK
jgi:tetratricopeptide (TPR) repeat protein